MFISFLLFIVSSFLLLAPSSLPDQPRLPAPRPPTAFSGPLSLSLCSVRTEEAGPAARRTNPSALSRLSFPRVPPHAPSANRAPFPPRQITQLRAGWAAGAPPLPRSAAAPRAAALGLSILPVAPHSVGLGRPCPEHRGRRCSSRGAGQRRRARRVPPAGRKGAPALPGPAARDPGLKRRRRPGCPGPVPGRRGPWPAVPGPECPRRASRRGPQSSRSPPGGPQPPRTHLRGPPGAQVRGRVRGEGASPGRQQGGGGAARRPRPHRSASRAR